MKLAVEINNVESKDLREREIAPGVIEVQSKWNDLVLSLTFVLESIE